MSSQQAYITLQSILCPAYNKLDQPGITNVTKTTPV